jgi:rod shape-determining protein MreD
MRDSHRNYALAVLAVLTVALQVYFFGNWRPFGVVPNLLLIVVIYVGLIKTATETLAAALVGGMLLDLTSGADFGLRMAFYAMTALLILVAKQSGLDFDNLGLIILGVGAGTALFNLAVLSSSINSAGISWSWVVRLVSIEIVINIFLTLVLRPILTRWLPRPSSIPVAG